MSSSESTRKPSTSEPMYKMWGLDDQISHMFGMPPVVDDGKDLLSKGGKVLRVCGDRHGYPGWITPCFLETLGGALKLGLKLLPEHDMFKPGSRAELFVTKMDKTKAVLEAQEEPMYSIPEKVANEAGEIMKGILATKEKIKLPFITKIDIVGSGISGLLSALFVSSLYELDAITVYEKENEVGGRLSKNYSGGMRFVHDACLEQLLQYLGLEIGSEECFEHQNINESTLLYTPGNEKDKMFEKFIGSSTHKNWEAVLKKMNDGFVAFKRNHGISKETEEDWVGINKSFLDLVQKIPDLRTLGVEKFLIDHCDFNQMDLKLFKSYGFGGGPGKLLTEKRFINLCNGLQDDRFGVMHVFMPHLTDILAEQLALKAGVEVKLEQAWHPEDYAKDEHTITLDATPIQLTFPLPESWQPFTAPKLCMELPDKELSSISSHVMSTTGDPLTSNIYFIDNIALSYVWMAPKEDHIPDRENADEIDSLKKDMKTSLEKTMEDILRWKQETGKAKDDDLPMLIMFKQNKWMKAYNKLHAIKKLSAVAKLHQTAAAAKFKEQTSKTKENSFGIEKRPAHGQEQAR